MTSVWDDPDLKPPAEEFVKLDNKGDKIGGSITVVAKHDFGGGDVAPQITFVDKVHGTGEEKTWTAGQLQAKRQLAELRPEPGDDFMAELTDVERRPGGKTLKHINIQVWRGGQRVHAAATAAKPSNAPISGLPMNTGPRKVAAAAAGGSFDDTPPF